MKNNYFIKQAVNSKAEQKETPGIKERAAKAYTPNVSDMALSSLLAASAILGNHYTDQSAPIGEMMADYAIDDLKKKGWNVEYYQSYPRSHIHPGYGPVGATINSFLVPGPPTKIVSRPRDPITGKRIPMPDKDLRNVFGRMKGEAISQEFTLNLFPDKMLKAKATGDPWLDKIVKLIKGRPTVDKLKNGKPVATDETARLIASAIGTDASKLRDVDAIVVAPRNNERAIAHEFGHMYQKVDSAVPYKNETLNKLKGIGDQVWRFMSRPLEGALPKDALGKVNETMGKIPNPMVRDITRTAIGLNTSVPNHLINLIKTINVFAPELSEKMEEKDPTGAIKFINENPAIAAGIAGLPHAIMEMSTTVPGTKLTYNFWKDLNSGKLNKHPFAKDVLKSVGKKLPAMEAAKFFGKNLFYTAAPIYAPLVGLWAYNKYKESQDSDKNG